MTITTIYNPGDTVWCLINNKATCTKTVAITHLSNEGGSIEERLQWKLEAHERSWAGIDVWALRAESELFRTKEELLASL